jgi:5-(aminomethyl)-3-furanmethanol phosphate kinase
VDVTVVKVGGSLAQRPLKLRTLCSKLSELSKNQGLVIVPGGGDFADVARKMDKQFALSPFVSHRMAILGMDAYGFLLADLIENSSISETFEKTTQILENKKLAVFLPSRFMFSEDPLANSWEVTSDAISVCIAGRLQVKRILLLTDVDGVFTQDPKKHKNAKLIDKISAQELLAQNKRSSVDCALPQLLLDTKIQCYVVNGFFVERVEAALNGKDTLYTVINS